ncbi:MAG TPA: LacI family DNA-binding transcriptional regulator [Brevefilum sp.]|nr:LacI family DNA-binding transcriptional regulator [Brevefilum sp.]HOR18602.1 LacI family DNA-binding transcriptional regulator [Brevefilum sp.]HPL69003.1 LacI family DNA-binding transcriptional regulator [Brevefilum sp.]
MATTIKTIAKITGVSHSTVSRALRGSPLVADVTAERIRIAAEQLDYLPSAAARSLKTKRTHVLGVILSGIADPFFSEVLNGIEGAAHAAGYSLFIGSSNHDADKEARIVQTMLEQRIDGGIICSTPVSIERWRQFPTDRFPIVVINNQAADHYNFSIYHDDIDGSRQLARHLIELGHRKIAYLGNSHSGKTTLDRLSGLQEEMEFQGLSVAPDQIHHAPGGSLQMGAEGMNYFLNLPHPPTAVMCFNDLLAIGALKACRQAGVRVPDEISVTGFDNIAFSEFSVPPLTTLDQPKYEIGRQAAQLLLSLLSEESGLHSHTQGVKVLKGRLLVRATTAKPRKKETL